MRALFIFSFWTLATASSVYAEPELAPEEALALRRIIDFWEEGEYQIAKNQMEDFLVEFSENSYSDMLRAALGDLFLREANYQIALNYYAQIADSALAHKIFPNRMQCLYQLEWHATLADECEAYLQRTSETLEDQGKLEATYFLAIALYQQCLSPNKDTSTIQALAERAKPYFERLSASEQSDEVAEALAYLHCLLNDFEGASRIYLDLSKKNNNSPELLFQAALIQSKYDKSIALQTFEELAKQESPFTKDAVYNQLILLFDLGRHEEITTMKDAILAAIPEERLGLSHLFIGQSFLALHQYREASIAFGKFLDSNIEQPSSIRPGLLHLLDAAYRAGDLSLFDDATSRLQRFDPKDAELPNAFFNRVQLLKRQEQFEEAKAALRSLFIQFPEAPNRAWVSLEVIQLESASHHWAACREMAQIFLKEYPTHELSSIVWRYLAASSIELASQSTELKQQCIQDLQSLLQTDTSLPPSEQLDFQFHLAKTHFALGSLDAATQCLHPLTLQTIEFEQKANAELLFALCASENRELFCTWAEAALSHHANLLSIADQHLALFNAYLFRAAEPKADSCCLGQAAEHLYSAFQSKASIQWPNLLWLANYTYEQRAKNILYAERSLEIISHLLENNPQEISQDTLYLEPLIVHAAELHRQLQRTSTAIELLTKLNEQYKATPTLAWTAQKQAKLHLAEWILEMGEQEAAGLLFDEISSCAMLRDPFAAKAALQSARLKSKYEHPNYVQILSKLKDLILQKTLSNEPIHLEAALDYIDLQSERQPLENKLTKRLELLTKTKTEFETQEDLLSKDYHAARGVLTEKNQIYLSYMGYLDAQILLTKAALESDPDQQKELQAKAKDILLQIIAEAPIELRPRLENDKNQ